MSVAQLPQVVSGALGGSAGPNPCVVAAPVKVGASATRSEWIATHPGSLGHQLTCTSK